MYIVTYIIYLSQAGSEENALEHLSHSAEELVTVRSLEHVDLVNDSLDLHWNYEVCIAHRLASSKEKEGGGEGGGGGGDTEGKNWERHSLTDNIGVRVCKPKQERASCSTGLCILTHGWSLCILANEATYLTNYATLR